MMYRPNRVKFNDGWRFRFENGDSETVILPHTWNALDTMSTNPDWHYRRGVGIYEKDFQPPDDAEGQTLWLEFEAIAQKAKVYFDNELLTEHWGGYTAFTVNIPNRAGTIRVEADNTPDPDLIPSDMSDFFLYGGITRNVWLYRTYDVWVESVQCDINAADINAQLTVHLTFGGDYQRIEQFAVNVQGIGFAAEIHEDIDDGVFDKSVTVEMPLIEGDAYKKWSPDLPHLYKLSISLFGYGDAFDIGAGEFDFIEETIGFRQYEFPEYGAFYLNGERLLLRGTHRHEDWAGYGCAVPDDITRKELQMIKDAGFNFVRTGHYPQSRAALEACDELGIIVWEELPWCRGGLGGDTFKHHAKTMLREMISQHYNHPSIIFWGLGNELDWESEHPESTDDKVCDFLSELNDLAHTLDASRLTALRRFDYGAHLVDVYSPSIWAGWYRGKYTDYEQNIRDAMAKYPRLLHAEWGGDSHAGRFRQAPHIHEEPPSTVDNAEEVGTATSEDGFTRYSKDGDWSETYILKLMDHHLMVQNKLENFAGSLQWAFKDFGTPLRPENPVPYVNQKGLVDRSGMTKTVYDLFQAWQSDLSVCYFADTLVRDEGTIQVIANCDFTVFWGKKVDLEVQDGIQYKYVMGQHIYTIDLPDFTKDDAWIWVKGSKSENSFADDNYPLDILMTANEEPVVDFRVIRPPKIQDNLRVLVYLLGERGHTQVDQRVTFTMLSGGRLLKHQGHMGGSDVIETANGRAWIRVIPDADASEIKIRVEVAGIGVKETTIPVERTSID